MNPSNHTFKLLVFDWDGTVMDSLATIVACAQESLSDVGLEPRDAEEIHRVIGLGLRETFDELYPDTSLELRQRMVERYRHHWITTYYAKSEPIAGAAEALAALAERDYLLAIATGKGRRGLERDLDATGLRDFFLATRTVDEAPSKPDPRMLLDLIDELGVDPRDTLMIGDTTYDLMMAREARTSGLGVLTGSFPRGTLMDCGALTCLDSVGQLPDWLSRTG